MNQELPVVQAGFRKGRRTRDQLANIFWIINKEREFQKNIHFIDYAKIFDFVDPNKLRKILKEMGIPDHLPLADVQLSPDPGDTAGKRQGLKESCWVNPF